MFQHFPPIWLLATFLCSMLHCSPTQEVDMNAEKSAIEQVIKNSIGWALTKNTHLLYRCFAQDEDLFWFTPEAGGTTRGFEAFKSTVESVFLNPAFKALRFEVRELQIHLSRSGDVAWFAGRLDDENEWDGRPASWLNVRWTGVLEKRDRAWVIVQQHFSYGQGEEAAAQG